MTDPIGTGALWIALPLAAAAGALSFASPCVLPLVPGYLGLIGGNTVHRSRWAPVVGAVLFVLGFAGLFVLYGAAFGSAGAWLIQWQSIVTRVLGLVVLGMGLTFIGVFRPLQRTLKWSPPARPGLATAPLVGVAFGLGWTPCLGPTLASISALSMTTASAGRGAILTASYAIGLGLPFILLAAGFSWAAAAVTILRAHIRVINITGGVALVVVGILMVSGIWETLISAMQTLIGGVTLPL